MTWADITPEQRQKLASWLMDQAHDMLVDREQMAEEHGFDVVLAIEALAVHVAERPSSGGAS